MDRKVSAAAVVGGGSGGRESPEKGKMEEARADRKSSVGWA